MSAENKEEAVEERKVFTEEEVEKHHTEGDCYLIIGNDKTGGPKVYNISPYLNDHPGGPEIMLEYAGKDADVYFEDIGHSSEARAIMKKFLIGELKVDPNAPKKVAERKATEELISSRGKGGLNPFAVIVLLVGIAVGVYFSQMK